MKNIYLFILLLPIAVTTAAQTWTGASGTNWNNASNWNPMIIPGSNDIAVIPAGAGNYPVLTNNITVRSINMQSGSQIDVNGFSITVISNDFVYFTGTTINNSNAATDIVLNITAASLGFTTYFKNNTVNDAIIFNLSGYDTFLDGDAGPANQFNGDVTYNISGSLVVNISHVIPSQFNANLTVNRTVKGETHVFNGGGNVTGNYTFTDNTGSITLMGTNTEKTSIAGTVNITVNDPSVNTATSIFEMHRIINQTTGGSILIQNTAGFTIEKDTLLNTALTFNGTRGNINGRILNSSLTCNTSLSPNTVSLGSVPVYITNNLFIGNTSFTFTGSVGIQFYEWGNHYIGNTIFTINSAATVQICYTIAGSIFDGDVTITRTVAGYTEAFTYGAVINGNFSYTNNTAGDTHLGNFYDFPGRKTVISGTINITAHYATPDIFALNEVMNQTGGGTIDVLNSRGFNIKKDTLIVNALNVSGYRDMFGEFFKNSITGNVTIADDPTNNGGFFTDMRNNVITGDCSFSNNANSTLFDAYSSGAFDYHNKYNGNVTYTRTNGEIYIGVGGLVSNTNEYSQNFTVNSSSKIFIGKIKFTGNGNSVIEQLGTQPIIVEQLTIEKTGTGNITLNDPVTISNTVTFVNGIIYSTALNNLTFANTATQTGASATSYLDGPVTKIGNTAFTFPVGKPGEYAPISISAPLNTTDAFRAAYFTNDPSGSGYTTTLKDATLNHLSSSEYWVLDRTVGTSTVLVTLSWDIARSGAVNNLPDLRVARWNGSMWKDEGNSVTTGTNTAGTVTSNVVSNFSPFTLASASILNPLPIHLVSFTGSTCNDGVCLRWITDNEQNCAGYTIEKSNDGSNFIGFVTVPSKNRITQNSYAASDQFFYGIGYYRLKIVDNNGAVRYSDVVKIKAAQPQIITLAPNPAHDFIILKNVSAYTAVSIIDARGKLLQQQLIKNSIEKIDITRLNAGLYWLQLVGSTQSTTLKLVKQ